MGGTTHVVGARSGYQLCRFKTWYATDPERAIQEFLSGISSEITLDAFANIAYPDFIAKICRSFKLGITCRHFLGYLHELICELFVSKIDQFVRDHPERAMAMGFREIVEAHPPNYTVNMSRLRNFRFNDWNHESLKGFCIFEPTVRLVQLLNFPITRFAELDLSHLHVEFPDPPTIMSREIQIRNPEDLYNEICRAQTDLDRMEQYYVTVCDAIKKLCDSFHS